MSHEKLLALAAACVFLGAACSGEHIVVASDEDVADAANDAASGSEPDASENPKQPDASSPAEPDASSPGEPCNDNADCSSTAFCSKVRCGDAQGVCEDRPRFCDDTQRFVCGCDRVSYFNDCLRRRNGVPAATDGACGRNAKRCSSLPGDQCSVTNATCALIRSTTCQPPDSGLIQGECWVAPASCGIGAGGDRFSSCELGPPGEHDCVSACEAISSGRQYVRVDHCRDRTGPGFGI